MKQSNSHTFVSDKYLLSRLPLLLKNLCNEKYNRLDPITIPKGIFVEISNYIAAFVFQRI